MRPAILLLLCASLLTPQGMIRVQRRAASCSTTADTGSAGTSGPANLGQFSSSAFEGASFTAGSTYTLCAVDILISKTNSPTFNVYAAIYNDVAGAPGTQVGTASSIVAANTFATSAVTYKFSTMNASLTSGTTYWIVMAASNTTDPNYVVWQYDNSGGGAKIKKSSDGATWTDLDTFVAGAHFTSYK